MRGNTLTSARMSMSYSLACVSRSHAIPYLLSKLRTDAAELKRQILRVKELYTKHADLTPFPVPALSQPPGRAKPDVTQLHTRCNNPTGTSTSTNSDSTLTVATINLWNINQNWPDRLNSIGKIGLENQLLITRLSSVQSKSCDN